MNDMEYRRYNLGKRMAELVHGYGLSIRQAANKCAAARSTAFDALCYFNDLGKYVEQGEDGPRILFIDIESASLSVEVFGTFNQNIGLSQIKKDWYILSFSAKWAHEDFVIYQDKRHSYDNENDRELCESMWQLLDEADIVVAHNGKGFDVKKMNTRFILHDMPPPSSYSVVDTLLVAKRNFGFTSNKLAFLTDKLCRVYKKLDHGKYPGFELWNQCLAGNIEAWDEMKHYNQYDVLSLEELYYRMLPWDNTHPNVALYYNDNLPRCRCGCQDMHWIGYRYTQVSKFDEFRCDSCGGTVRGRVNLVDKEKLGNLTTN